MNKTYEDWRRDGRQVMKGEKAHCFIDGKAHYSFEQTEPRAEDAIDKAVFDLRQSIRNKQAELWPDGYCLFPIQGNCYSCGYDLILNCSDTDLATKMITSCPKCSRSFVS